MGMHMLPPAENPYAGLFSLIGTIMGKNAKQRNEVGIANTIEGLGNQQQPQPQVTPQPQQGLLPTPPINNPDVNNFSQNMINPQPIGSDIGQSQMARMATMNQQPQSIQQKTVAGTFGNMKFDPQPATEQPQIANTNDYGQVVNEQPIIPTTVPQTEPQITTPPAHPTAPIQAPIKTSIANNYKQQSAQAIAELVKNRGMSLKDAKALVDSKVNQLVEEDFNNSADEYAKSMDSQLEPFLGMDFQTSGSKAKFIGFLAKYNSGMKRIGRDGADIGMMKELMGQGDVVMAKEDNGGQYRYVMVKKNGERFDDGSFQKPAPGGIGEWVDKQLTPGEKQSGELTRRGQDITMRGQDLSHSAAMSRGGGSGGAGDREASRQIGAAKSAIAMHEQWLRSRKDATGQMPDATESPYFKSAQAGQGILQRTMNMDLGVPEQQAVPNVGDNRIDGMIANMRSRGASEDMINEMVYQEQNRPVRQQQQSSSNPYIDFSTSNEWGE